MAHHPIVVAARLPVLPLAYAVARRISRGPAVGQFAPTRGPTPWACRYVHAGGPVARGGVDVCRLGGGPRRLPARFARHDAPQAKRRARVGLRSRPRLHAAAQIGATFMLVSAAWVLFRATSFENAWTYARYLQFRLPPAGMANLLFDLALVAVFLSLEWVQRNRPRLALLDRMPIEVKSHRLRAVRCRHPGGFSVNAANPFIYFRF